MIWAVLSTLLDTQDHKLKYVKFLQAEYNRYYDDKTREYIYGEIGGENNCNTGMHA